MKTKLKRRERRPAKRDGFDYYKPGLSTAGIFGFDIEYPMAVKVNLWYQKKTNQSKNLADMQQEVVELFIVLVVEATAQLIGLKCWANTRKLSKSCMRKI